MPTNVIACQSIIDTRSHVLAGAHSGMVFSNNNIIIILMAEKSRKGPPWR